MAAKTDTPFADWVGRASEAEDVVTARLVAGLRAIFGDRLAAVDEGDAPLGIHWCLSPAIVPMGMLGQDGHPAKNRDLPPIPLPRRMWAGGAVKHVMPIRLGDVVKRISTIASVTRKQGRSGELWFVGVDHEYVTPRGTAVRERQDIVYREAAPAETGAATSDAARGSGIEPIEGEWIVDTSTTLLFRYSALTFNGHRIHYDLPYATAVEFYPGLVVHGPMQATLLLNFAARALGGTPGRFSYRGLAPAFAGNPLRVPPFAGKQRRLPHGRRGGHRAYGSGRRRQARRVAMKVQTSAERDSLGARGVFIDNHWTPAASGRELDVVAPADGAVFARIAAAGAEDIDRAVSAARRAFDGGWGRLAGFERGRLLSRLGLLVLDHAEELSALEARDCGKPLKQARADIAACARYFEFYGGAADKWHGSTIPFLSGYFVATEREPHGVTGHVIPWNYPAQMFGRTLAPALAAGNAVVMKPAEDACLTPIRLVDLATEAGFPEGAINLVPGLGAEAGRALISHPGVDFLSFTGSPEVGVMVQTEAARNHIGCTLELGGKSPQVVFADVELEAALPSLVNAIVQNAGQTCSAGSRLLIQKSGYDRIVGAVAERFSTLRAGTPEMDLDLGPLISARQKRRVEAFCDRADADGIVRIAEGTVANDVPKDGFFVTPKLYGPVPRGNVLARDEVFGPVLAIIPFEDEAEALAIANGTDFGLIAGVWTADAKRATRVARKIRAGQVYVNAYGAGGGIELPFGGIRKSGHGREKGLEALHEFTTLKTIVFKHD